MAKPVVGQFFEHKEQPGVHRVTSVALGTVYYRPVIEIKKDGQIRSGVGKSCLESDFDKICKRVLPKPTK